MKDLNHHEEQIANYDWTNFKICTREINLKTLLVIVDDNQIREFEKLGLIDIQAETAFLRFVQHFIDKEDVNKLKIICNKAIENLEYEFLTTTIIRFAIKFKLEIPCQVNFTKPESETLVYYAQNILDLPTDLCFTNNIPTLRMVLENTDDNIFIIGRDLIFLDYNDVFEDISNRFLNKCIKRGMSHNDFVPEVLHSVLIACVNQAFVKESSFLETTFVTDKEFLF
jgi:PAS domain-containing protein